MWQLSEPGANQLCVWRWDCLVQGCRAEVRILITSMWLYESTDLQLARLNLSTFCPSSFNSFCLFTRRVQLSVYTSDFSLEEDFNVWTRLNTGWSLNTISELGWTSCKIPWLSFTHRVILCVSHWLNVTKYIYSRAELVNLHLFDIFSYFVHIRAKPKLFILRAIGCKTNK